MSEPTNPLFEEEKAFLERKKLEYERALRGDVAMLKEQAGHAGRIAAVGAGLAGSIWLITKAFSSRKKTRPNSQPDFIYDSYAPADDYPTQHFGDYDPYDDANDYRSTTRWNDGDVDYFGGPDSDDEAHGTVYHSDTDRYDTPSAYADEDDDQSAEPSRHGPHGPLYFPHHANDGHRPAEAPGQKAEHFESEAYGHPESTLPFDDSRRLPESEDFPEEAPTDEHETFERRIPTPPNAEAPKQNLGSMLAGLARTSAGKVLVGQAFSFGLALAAKAIRAKLEGDEAETPKNSDLADSTEKKEGDTPDHSATSQPDAHHSSAEASTF